MPKPASKPLIAVDVDDVVYPLVPSLIEYLDTEHKVRLTEHDFKEYDLRKVWGGGPEEATKVFEAYKHHVGVQIAPIKGAVEALQKLSKKYEVIVLTARDISNFPRTSAWVERHFPEIFKDVHLIGNKQDSENYRTKADVCIELGVQCLVDDNLNNVLETHAVGVKTLLFGNYSWNQTDELPEGVTRVKDWQAVLEYFGE
jgi:5'(3')-deoxyribonucleotidase